MPRPPADDPLIPLPVRLPTTTVEQLRREARAAGCSVSDVLRSYLTLADAKPLGKPRPRKREPQKLGAVSGADPALLRELAGIGNNINKLARSVSAGLLVGTPIESVRLLTVLRGIEQELMRIGEHDVP